MSLGDIYMLSYRKKNKQDDKNIKRPVTARRDIYLPKYGNYFLKLRNLYKSLSY